MTPREEKDRLTAQGARKALEEADRLYTAQEVEVALDRMAQSITDGLADRDPLVLCVMIGGLYPAAALLRRLDFPLQVDYIHATRYEGDIRGEELRWRAPPASPLTNRTILIIDDILDEGLTLAAVLDYCASAGARDVYSAVLVEKQHARKPAIDHADFTGLTVGDRYVFGCGMDYKGYLRNVTGIYAVKGL